MLYMIRFTADTATFILSHVYAPNFFIFLVHRPHSRIIYRDRRVDIYRNISLSWLIMSSA